MLYLIFMVIYYQVLTYSPAVPTMPIQHSAATTTTAQPLHRPAAAVQGAALTRRVAYLFVLHLFLPRASQYSSSTPPTPVLGMLFAVEFWLRPFSSGHVRRFTLARLTTCTPEKKPAKFPQ